MGSFSSYNSFSFSFKKMFVFPFLFCGIKHFWSHVGSVHTHTCLIHTYTCAHVGGQDGRVAGLPFMPDTSVLQLCVYLSLVGRTATTYNGEADKAKVYLATGFEPKYTSRVIMLFFLLLL